MKLLVVGFNARPIVRLAKKAKYDVGAIDYFGDSDLLKLTKNCFSVLRQKPGQTLHRPLHRKPAEYLYYLAEIMADEQGDFDGILLGSAFDRYPELIKKFLRIGPNVYANTPTKYRLVRNKEKINSIAKNAGFEIPDIEYTKGLEELVEIAKNKTFPLVTRSDGGGGGAGIKFWKSYAELVEYADERDNEKEYWLQEYIEGTDASASVITSGEKVNIISINQQLMGDLMFGAPGKFSYCGNIVPLGLHKIKEKKEFYEELLIKIEKLFKQLELMGSNGVDFVLRDDKAYFMEVNPRLQGSIECIHYATGINVVQAHIDAFTCGVQKTNLRPKYRRSSVKGILFSNNEEDFTVESYPVRMGIVDRTHIGTILEKGDPFCSIVIGTRNARKGYKKVCTIAKEIYNINQGTEINMDYVLSTHSK